MSAPCFVTGTRITTTRGDVAVEDLAVGDLAVTASGAARPIRRVGHRPIACRAHAPPETLMPVRVARDAFGAGRPARDLRLAPDHGICLDLIGEVLIPAAALVNGATLAQETVEHGTYWQVELDGHDILQAEGLPAEAGVADPSAFRRPHRSAGALVRAVQERLRERALALGWRLELDLWTGTYLLVDGARLDPSVEGLSARFAMPAAAWDVWLVSDTTVPSQVGDSSDARILGVCVEGLHVADGAGDARPVDLADPSLCVGFHEVEAGPRRWTAGRARLPRALWARCRAPWSLRLDLTASTLPRWRAPREAVGEAARIGQDPGRAERPIA